MKYFIILLSLLFLNLLFSGCAAQKNGTVQVEKTSVKKETTEKIEKKEEQKINSTKEATKDEPKVIVKEKTKIVVVEKPVSDSKVVVGSIEYVYVPAVKVTYKAKVDTGATTTSMHALDIKPFERDGEKWVKFKLSDTKGGLIEKMLPVERIVSIKRHGSTPQNRFVVKMRLNLGDVSEVVDVSLTDRSKFKYPVLVGRNFLNGYIVVDVSKNFLTKPKR